MHHAPVATRQDLTVMISGFVAMDVVTDGRMVLVMMVCVRSTGRVGRHAGRGACQENRQGDEPDYAAAKQVLSIRAGHDFTRANPAMSSRIGQSGLSSPWQFSASAFSVFFIERNCSILRSTSAILPSAKAFTSALARSSSS